MNIEKFERNMNLYTEYLSTGNNYLQANLYHAAIEEYTKVISSLPKAIEVAKKESHPPVIIALYLQLVSNALIGRQVAYLSVGEKQKAHADEETVDTISKIITKINLQAQAVVKKKEEEASGGCLSEIISIIIFIIIIYSWLK